MFPDHLPFGAELRMAAQAEIAATAGDEILHINAVARRDVIDFCTHCFHPTRDLVPESHWQWISRRNACAIVRIGMADPARRHANQNFGGPISGSAISASSSGFPSRTSRTALIRALFGSHNVALASLCV